MKFSRIAAAAAACISVGFAGGARAAADMVFDFSGVCDNCADYGTGVLTLTSDYQLGDYITTSNFVSFTYSSSDTSYTLTSSDSFFFIGGNVLSTPGQNYVHFRLTSTADQFSSDGSGAWCAGADGCSDTGSSSTWTAAGAAGAPEPAAWALMIAGTWAIGGALRGSRRRLARSA